MDQLEIVASSTETAEGTDIRTIERIIGVHLSKPQD